MVVISPVDFWNYFCGCRKLCCHFDCCHFSGCISAALISAVVSSVISSAVVIFAVAITVAVISAVVNSCGFPIRPDATTLPQMLKADANSNRRRDPKTRGQVKGQPQNQGFLRRISVGLARSLTPFSASFLLFSAPLGVRRFRIVICFSSFSVLFAPAR